jgi:isopenicillin-N epimerase
MAGVSRRGLLTAAAIAPALGALAPPPGGAPDDEAYWKKLGALFDQPPPGVVQLENGQFGAMARPVRAAFERHTLRINSETTIYTRGTLLDDLKAVREKAARMLGVGADEIAFTRGGTESMQVLIFGYNKLKPGDAVLYADLDYDSMQTGMDGLAKLRGVRVARFNLPEPSTKALLIEAYDKALKANPDVRLLLLTHLSHRTGLMPPVAEIVALAKSRGVDVLLDCGHALGQTDFSLPGMGVEFAGLNLHKWIGAPVGVGLVYIRKARLQDIDASLMDPAGAAGPIDTRIHTGTSNYAAILGVSDAIDFHLAVGVKPKAARLRYLRDRWVRQVRGVRGVEVLTPDDPALHAGITSFRLTGKTSLEDNVAVKTALFDKHRIFTVERPGPQKGACVRVSPSYINTPADMDALAAAIRGLARA